MKKILLQTMPHTGTHMMHYLFNVLGGIPVIWHHWEDNGSDDIEIAKALDWKDFVFVRTHRPTRETIDSYLERDCIGGEQYYEECWEVFTQYRRCFPRPVVLELGDNEQMTTAAMEIFRRCIVIPPRPAIKYMKTWDKIASHNGEPPNAAIKKSIHDGRMEAWHTK